MLLQGNCVKRAYGGTSLSLEAKAGESFLVKCLTCRPNSADEYLVLRVDRKTVGVYRVYGKGGNQLRGNSAEVYPMNLTDFLLKQGVNIAIPVAEGQTFSIDSINAATEIVVEFERYSAGDITAIMPNGSDSKEYTFLQYMTSSENLAVDGDLLIDQSLSPAEFPDFPCGKVVPAKTTINMLGLVGNPKAYGFGGTGIITTYVKLVKDREILFDPDRNGIPFRGQPSGGHTDSYQTDFSLIGGCIDGKEDSQKADISFPLMFNPMLNFVSGEELLIYVTIDQLGSGTFDGDKIDLAAILNVKTE